ncbi:MAG TPA: hypothetical protein VF920_14325 [Dongiaceae bacterium]
MQTSRIPDWLKASGTPIHHNDQLIGYLVEDAQRRYRFAALDDHFDLLDGSRFVAPHRALAAVARLSQFIEHPIAANEA